MSCSNTDSSPTHFTGKEHDAESGFDNFGPRFNTSRWGRFLSPDWSDTPQSVPHANPTNPQSLNLYTYGRNNPLSYMDRDGHCTEPITFVVCIAIGVGAAVWSVHELHEWQKKQEKAENAAFQQSYDCAMGGATCTEAQIREYDTERVHTYGQGASQAIESTVPDATPATSITDVIIDQAKDKVVDKMVADAKKTGEKQQEPNPPQAKPQQQNSQKRNPQPQPTTPPCQDNDKGSPCHPNESNRQH